jgi:hypothetical protein
VQSQDSPQDPLRFLLEKIMPMLNKNIMTANTRIVRNIVTITMSKVSVYIELNLLIVMVTIFLTILVFAVIMFFFFFFIILFVYFYVTLLFIRS